jgi:hypothetical protein
MTTTTATNTTVKITSRSGSFLNKSGSFNLTYFGSIKTPFTNEVSMYKTHHFTFSINFNPAHLSYDKKIHCVKNWTMYYFSQNKNGTWKKQWQHIVVDETLMNEIIGANNRIEIETQLHDELLEELSGSLVAIQKTFPQYYSTPTSLLTHN